MKIYNPHFIQQKEQTGQEKTEPQKTQRGESFLDILKAASTKKSEEIKGTTPVGLTFPKDLGLTALQKSAISKGEETLGLLNHLAGLFTKEDSSKSALDSIANALSHNIDELKELKKGLDSNDPLRNTLDEIEIISMVEKIKITRGDYT